MLKDEESSEFYKKSLSKANEFRKEFDLLNQKDQRMKRLVSDKFNSKEEFSRDSSSTFSKKIALIDNEQLK
jgi:hypothetical protein